MVGKKKSVREEVRLYFYTIKLTDQRARSFILVVEVERHDTVTVIESIIVRLINKNNQELQLFCISENMNRDMFKSAFTLKGCTLLFDVFYCEHKSIQHIYRPQYVLHYGGPEWSHHTFIFLFERQFYSLRMLIW